MANSAWFEEENELIKSCGALQSALGLSKSFSTSDIADVTTTTAATMTNTADSDYWPADNDDIRAPRSASELAINRLRIDSDVLLMSTAMPGRLGNTSRSLSTCVVVGDMASTSQLPSPNRYSGSSQNNCVPSAFSSTDLVRSVNKKVRVPARGRSVAPASGTLLSTGRCNIIKAGFWDDLKVVGPFWNCKRIII